MSPAGRCMRVFFAVSKHIPRPLYIRSDQGDVDWYFPQDAAVRRNYLTICAGKHAHGPVLSCFTHVSLTKRSLLSLQHRRPPFACPRTTLGTIRRMLQDKAAAGLWTHGQLGTFCAVS